jgi:hypothetical protein
MTTRRAFPLAALALVVLLASGAPPPPPAAAGLADDRDVATAEPPPTNPAGAWRRLDPDIAWGEPAAAVDAANDRLVVVADRLDAIWTLDLAAPAAWKRVPVRGAPAGGRDGQPLLHDAARDRWIGVRLGSVNPNHPAEIRVLEPSGTATPAWTLVHQGFDPPANRNFASVVFDPAGNRVLAYGGVAGPRAELDPYFVNPDRILTDLWEYDFDGTGAWRSVAFEGEGPKVAPGGAAFVDEVNRRLLLVGVEATAAPTGGLARIWALPLDEPGAWTVLATVSESWVYADVFGTAWFLDAARGRLISHGGRLEHGHGPWVRPELLAVDLATGASRYLFFAGDGPGGRWGHAVAYDARRDRLLLQGGWPGPWKRGASRETWALPLASEEGWTRIGPWEGGPPWREGESSAYDPAGERVLTWGGGVEFPCLYFYCQTRVYGDVWSYDLSRAGTRDWDFHPGPPGEGRIGASLVHDPASRRLVAFGGVGQPSPPVTFFNDTAQFPLDDPGRWTLLSPGGSAPGARYLHASVVDPKRRRMLVLGGSSGFGFGNPEPPLADAWSLDLAGNGGWTRLELDSSQPTPGPGLQAALDPPGDRVLALSWPSPLGRPALWEFRLDGPPAWTRLDVADADGPESVGRVAWDPVRGRLLLFEHLPQAWNTLHASLRVWALDVTSSPALWRRLDPAGAADVPGLSASPVVYDAVHDRFVIAHPGAESQVWALEFGQPRWPISLSWAPNGGGRGNEAASHHVVLHGASPPESPIFPRPIDLSRIDPATWTWTGVEPRVDGQGRSRIEVGDVDGDGIDDWTVSVQRRGGPNRGGEPIRFSAIDRDGVLLEGSLAFSAAPRVGLHGDSDVTADAADDDDVFTVRPVFARGGGPRLSFAGTAGEPVTATLYDVRGRRLATRTWTPAGSAPEIVGWDGVGRIAPGIYLARVRQGAREATVRLVTL